LVVDPIAAFVSTAINTHADAPVRRALAPLAQMADRLDLAVVVVMHLTKDDSQRLMTRVGGSGAFVNAARSVLAMVRDPDDPDGEQGRRRLVLHAASNWGEYAPTLAVHMEGREVDTDDGKRTTTGYLVVDGESSVTVDDVQRGPDDAGGDAEELIAVALAGGPRPSRDVKGEVARELDCSRRTVERAAGRMVEQGELAIESSKFPRRTTWTLTATTPAVTTTSKAPRVATDQNGATEPNLARQEVQSRHAPPYGTTDATGATKDADDAPLDLLADYRRRRDGMLGERWDDDQ
jgi:putative DNA primase/helicase